MMTRLLVSAVLAVLGFVSVAGAGEVPLQAPEGKAPLRTLGMPQKGISDLDRFIANAPVIESIHIENAYFTPVTELVPGQLYYFWVNFVAGVCEPFTVDLGFFRPDGKMVYRSSSTFTGSNCNVTGVGIPLTVPANAPLQTYTWGARAENAYGTDTFYPASFTIVPW